METAAGSRGDRECCRADGRDLAADFGKNGKREEWELEHWDQWLNEIADKNEDAACGEKQEKQAEEELSAFTEQYENAQSAWTDACLFWYDIWCEAHPEPVMDPGTSDTDGSVPQDTESSKTDGSEI